MDAKSLREAMKEKAKRLSGATSEKVDASTFTPAEPLNADVKTGARPISRRAFKVGGKVAGAEAMTHAGRTPRKSGGKTEYANALVNRNVKDANEEREGKKHVGGFAKGGAPEYNEESVEKAIQSSRQKIGKKESSAIHSLLKGRKASMPMKDEDDDGKMGFKNGGRIAKMGGGLADLKSRRRMTDDGYENDPYRRIYSDDENPMNPSKDKLRQGQALLEEEQRRVGDMTRRKDGGKAEASGYARGGSKMKKAAERDIGEVMAEEEMPSYKAKKIGRKAMKDMPTADIRKKMGDDRSMERGAFMPSMNDDPYKRGGKAEKFEGSAKDEMQDKKLAAKRGMSMKEWEASDADDKHDKQESMKGLKSGGRTAKMSGGSMGYAAGGKLKMVEKDGKKVPFFAADGVGKMKSGGKAMHHDDCMCKACGGSAMKSGGGLYANINAKRERIENGSKEKMRKVGSKGAPTADAFKDSARTARKSGGKVGKSNISINIFPHNAEKAGAMPVPPAGMPPMPPMGAAPMMKPPMPAPSPMPSAPPPAHMSLPPGLMAAMSGAAGAGAMPPAGGPMPPPMMGRKAGGKVVYPITGGAGGGRARKEKVEAYGEKMNKDLKK